MPALCLSVLRETDTPVVGTFHASNDWSLGYRVFRPLLSLYAGKLSARIAVSDVARRTVESQFPGHYRVIPNGVDVQRFASAPPIAELRDGRLNVLFVGRFEPRKGLKFLFGALPEIIESVPEREGRGGGRRSASRATTRGSCRTPAGTRSTSRGSSRARCSPATSRAPTSSARRPWAARASGSCSSRPWPRASPSSRRTSRATGPSSATGRPGFSCRAARSDAIARAVVTLARDAELRRRLADAARRAVERYSWETVTDEIVRVYEEVLGGARSARPTPPRRARGSTGRKATCQRA